MNIVCSLVGPIENTNRTITTDNWFTSLELARSLQGKGLNLVGTIKKNRREVPDHMRTHKKRDLYSTHFLYNKKDAHQLTSYKAKKDKVVVLLSTIHRTNAVSKTTEAKPSVIDYYNKTKYGVDCADQMSKYYSTKLTTKRWPLAVFCNILDLSLINSFILHKLVDPSWNQNKKHRRRLFLLELADQLCADYRQRRESQSTSSTLAATSSPLSPGLLQSLSNNVERSPKAVRCHICERKKDRKTNFRCLSCTKPVCKEHSKLICHSCCSWTILIFLQICSSFVGLCFSLNLKNSSAFHSHSKTNPIPIFFTCLFFHKIKT